MHVTTRALRLALGQLGHDESGFESSSSASPMLSVIQSSSRDTNFSNGRLRKRRAVGLETPSVADQPSKRKKLNPTTAITAEVSKEFMLQLVMSLKNDYQEQMGCMRIVSVLKELSKQEGALPNIPAAFNNLG